MSSLMSTWTSSSIMDGGGVHGTVVGIDRGIIIQVGGTTGKFHLFIDRSPRNGGMTIGSIIGEVINGTTNEYPTNKFKESGATGKRLIIGKINKLGESRICITKHSPDLNHKRQPHSGHNNTGRQSRNTMRTNQSNLSNPINSRESMKKEMETETDTDTEKNKIGGRAK